MTEGRVKTYELRAGFTVEMDEKDHDDPLARLASFAGMYFSDLNAPHRHFAGRAVTLKWKSSTARIIRLRKGLYRVWLRFLCRGEDWLKREEVIEEANAILNEFSVMKDDLGPSMDGYEPAVENVHIVRRVPEEVAEA